MLETDKLEFAEIWGAAWAMYGKVVTTQLLSMAFEALRSYSIQEVRIGLTRHIQSPDTGQFTPKPADVIKQIDGNASTRAMIAWNKVDRAVRLIGAWSSVIFDDGLIHRVISDMGGWVQLCKTEDKEYSFKQKEFLARYQTYLVRNSYDQYPKVLSGLSDQHNVRKGLDLQTPFSVGDSAKALQVYANGALNFNSVYIEKINSKTFHKLIGNQVEDNNETVQS